MSDGARARVAAVIGAVARQALADHGATRIAVLDDATPEAALAVEMLAAALGPEAVEWVRATPAEVESVLHLAPGTAPARARDEALRLRARLLDGALAAHPANKTALLLGGALPPEPLLPLGDLWASQVEALCGGWSAPAAVCELAGAAGGIAPLDRALAALLEGRDGSGLDALPDAVAERVRQALGRGRAARLHPRLVPKLGTRTLCADLFE